MNVDMEMTVTRFEKTGRFQIWSLHWAFPATGSLKRAITRSWKKMGKRGCASR